MLGATGPGAGHVPLNVYLGAIAGGALLWANWAQQYNNCIAINFTWVGSWHPWYWTC